VATSESAPTTTTTTSPPTTTEAEPETIWVRYTVTVGGEQCSYVQDTYDDMWGFDDIPGMEFQARDESDRVIGHGSLPRTGEDSYGDCQFRAEPVEVAKSTVYRIGNPDRGYVTWDHDDVGTRNRTVFAGAIV